MTRKTLKKNKITNTFKLEKKKLSKNYDFLQIVDHKLPN